MTNQTYDEIISLVAIEMDKTDDTSFGVFSKIDKKLKLPSGSSWDASGWKDYFDFVVEN